MRGERGFSMTEIMVALAVLTILAGAVTPMAVNQIGRARRARAMKEVATLADSVQMFRYDVKAFPDRRNGKPGKLGYLLTDGKKPKGLGSWSGPMGRVEDHLLNNSPQGKAYSETGIAAWKGPYINRVPVDPWGRAYVMSVAGLRGGTGSRGWILSAGPNGTIETDDADESIPASSDDLGWRMR